MTLFAALAVALGLADALYHRLRRAGGGRRISRHLPICWAAPLPTITAVLVVNVETNPPWIAWILPTVVITPLIVWWNIRFDANMPGRSRDEAWAIREVFPVA